MIFKIKTSKKTMLLFEEIAASTSYPPFILSKLSISLSLKSNHALKPEDFCTDSLGLELNRQTITGEWDDLYKALIELREGVHLDDDTYIQKFLKAHLDRGALLLYGEYRSNNDLLTALLQDKKVLALKNGKTM